MLKTPQGGVILPGSIIARNRVLAIMNRYATSLATALGQICVKVEASIGSKNRAYEITRLACMMSGHPALLMEDMRAAV